MLAMSIGIISIILGAIAILPCFAPGAMSAIGVFISLFALLLSCFSTIKGKVKYLVYVLFIVTFNIFIVSEFSFALNKNLYSHKKTPLREITRLLTHTEEETTKKEQSKKALEEYLGHEITVDYKCEEEGYWQFVKMVGLIIFSPYLLSFYRLYYVLRYKST